MSSPRSGRPRIQNPALTFPAARRALLRLRRVGEEAGLPETLRLLVEVRASQLNGCAVCLDMHVRELRAAGDPSHRVDTIAAWRETPYFSDAERAALALTEAVTRLADSPPRVTDEVWAEATHHFNERQLAALVLAIATINAWNRVQVATGQVTGEWVQQVVEEDRRSS